MLVLGIDPGTALTGYAIVEEYSGQDPRLIEAGVLRTDNSTPMPQRLQTIYQGITELARRFRPESAAVEELFFSKNARTALVVGQARGVVLLALADSGLPTYEYKPAQIKEAITGYGSADKKQMQEMVRLLLHLPAVLRPDDAADAAAIAICHLQCARFARALGERDRGYA